MKKQITLLFISLFCFTACTQQTTTNDIPKAEEQNINKNIAYTSEQKENEQQIENIEQNVITNEDVTYHKSFGSYRVPKNWIESTKYSTEDKFFYVAEGTEEDPLPNNISVNVGKNKYSSEQHMKFRDAILNQLVMQLPKDVILNGNGSYTANDYVLYTFTFSITEGDTTLSATQYYIVADYKYVMVYETAFTDNTEEVDIVAKSIVDTFKWSE
ncbi:MAG: hypothetical protein HFE57_12625 [Firmicutes bacterium]|nr:hypothetical protein [Bacillota bacterium]